MGGWEEYEVPALLERTVQLVKMRVFYKHRLFHTKETSYYEVLVINLEQNINSLHLEVEVLD